MSVEELQRFNDRLVAGTNGPLSEHYCHALSNFWHKLLADNKMVVYGTTEDFWAICMKGYLSEIRDLVGQRMGLSHKAGFWNPNPMVYEKEVQERRAKAAQQHLVKLSSTRTAPRMPTYAQLYEADTKEWRAQRDQQLSDDAKAAQQYYDDAKAVQQHSDDPFPTLVQSTTGEFAFEFEMSELKNAGTKEYKFNSTEIGVNAILKLQMEGSSLKGSLKLDNIGSSSK